MTKGTEVKFILSRFTPTNVFTGTILSVFKKYNKELIRIHPTRLNGKFLSKKQLTDVTIIRYMIIEEKQND